MRDQPVCFFARESPHQQRIQIEQRQRADRLMCTRCPKDTRALIPEMRDDFFGEARGLFAPLYSIVGESKNLRR